MSDALEKAVRHLEALFGAEGTTWPQMLSGILHVVDVAKTDALRDLAFDVLDGCGG